MASNPYANLVKMLNAITLLSQPSGTTIKSLMARLDVSRRTVFRLLEALDGLGFPVINDRPEFGGEKIYRLIDSFVQKLPNISLPGIGFTPKEALFIQSVLANRHTTPDTDTLGILDSLETKLEGLNKSRQKADDDERSRHPSHHSPHDIEGLGPILDPIHVAIDDHRACAIRFRNYDPPGSRLYVIHPLKLIEDGGAFYLFAALPDHEGIRLLPIDRIASIEVLSNVFPSTTDEALDAFLAHGFDLDDASPITVEIRVPNDLQLPIHSMGLGPLRKTVRTPDGSIVKIVTTDPDGLMRLIISLGPSVEIISPDSLRRKAEAFLSSQLALYSHRSQS